MSDRPSDGGSDSKVSFWSTVPGILTGITGVITAIGALILALDKADLFPQKTPPSDTSSSPSEPISANQTNGSFPVNARYSYEFTNPSQEPKTISLRASGQWLAIPENYEPPNGYVSPQGYTDRSYDDTCYCPKQVIGALVGIGDQDCFLIGKEKVVTLAGGQSMRLFMNDVDVDTYHDGDTAYLNDNKGEITVEWSFAD